MTTASQVSVHATSRQYVFTPHDLGFRPERVWCPVPTSDHQTKPYDLPQTVRISTKDTPETGAKFSPSPYAVVVEGEGRRCFVGVKARRGWHRWNLVQFVVTANEVRVVIDLEGHTCPEQARSREKEVCSA